MRRLKVWLVLCVVLIGSTLPAAAQDGSGHPAITRDNVDQVVELARLGRGTISKVAWSPDGATLAVMGAVGVWLYDAGNLGAEPRLLEGHTEHLLDLAFSPDGSLLATGSADHTARVWDVASGDTVLTLSLDDWARSVAFSPDGQTLATGAGYDDVRLWDITTGELVRTREEFCQNLPVDLAFSPDGTLLACASDSIYSDAPRGVIAWWNLDTDAVTRGEYSRTPANAVAFNPDGTMLAGSQNVLPYDDAPQAPVVLWDTATDALTQDGVQPHPLTKPLAGHSLAFNRTGDLLACAGGSGGVQIIDVVRDYETQRLHEGYWVSSVAFSPVDDRVAYITEDDIATHDYSGRLYVRDLNTGAEQVVMHDTPITRVAFMPDGERVVVGRVQGSVELWNIMTGQLERVLLSPGSGGVARLAISPDGSLVAVSTVYGSQMRWGLLYGTHETTGNVLLLDTATGRVLWQVETAHYACVPDVAFTHDGGALLYSCDREDRQVSPGWQPVRALDIATLESRVVTDQMTACASSIAVNAAGQGVFMMDGSLFMWFDAGLEEIMYSWRYRPDDDYGNEGSVTVLAWSADGTAIGYAVYRPAHGGGWSMVYVWRDFRGESAPVLLEDYHRPYEPLDAVRNIYQVAFNGDGSLLLTAGEDHYGAQGDIRVWDVEAEALVVTLHGHHRASISIAVSPDGSRIVTGGVDGTLRVWGVP